MVVDVEWVVCDGAQVAYGVDGRGPVELVLCEPGMASFDALGDVPAMAAFVERLAAFARVVQFDRRGVGLSDAPRGAETVPLEARVDDLAAVLDAVRSSRAVVVGIFNGAWAAALFAASHPDRVAALILHNPVACGLRSAEYPWGGTLDGWAAHEQLVRASWGTRAYARWDLDRIAPSLAHDPDIQARWAAMVRRSATPATEIELTRLEAQLDIRSVLPVIRVPTLIIRRGGEAAEARYIADRIPGSDLVELPGVDIAPFAGDPSAVPDAIRGFLERLQADTEPDRILASILVTDIIASTDHATRLGDRGWRQLLQDHHALVRGQLARFRGTELDTAGDGFLASFDSPARALRCACRIRDAVPTLGVQIRAGVHTGECERLDGKLAGIGVHTAARIAQHAHPSEVLVSNAVTELVAGSTFRFTARGTHHLKGIGDRALYAAHDR
jgi:class 3 adenylate cyclase